MTERRNLLASITNTIKDYRAGEIPEPTPGHVDEWINQFDENVQLLMLRELDHVFKLTYKPKLAVKNFLESVATHEALVGSIPRDFWRNARILNIQRNGRSQAEMRMLFGEILKERYGLNIDHGGPSEMLKPLGYSLFDPGFGSMFVTYRNCPNNCPLALWYGNPEYPSNHPFSRWYPLFPRKTYDP